MYDLLARRGCDRHVWPSAAAKDALLTTNISDASGLPEAPGDAYCFGEA